MRVRAHNLTLGIGLAGLAALLFAGCQRPQPPGARFSTSNVVALRTALGGDKAAAAGPAVVAAEPKGWATLKGVVKMVGTPPPRATLTIDKEQQVCMPGGKPVLAQDVVVDAGGGIRDVVIFLETKYPDSDPKWEHPDYAAAKTGEVVFDQKNCIFLTHVFTMRASQSLKVLNSDPVGHNTKLEGGDGAHPDNFLVPAGGSVIYSPGGESPEPFKVACNIHTWMSANGIVRKSPYFAVTNAQGEFELKKLPAGVPLKFRVWQERASFIKEAKGTGKIDKFGKGRLELTLDPDENRQIELVAEASLFGGK